MSSFNYLKDFVKNRLTAAEEDIYGAFQKPVVKEEEEINGQRRLLEICLRAELKLHRIDCPQHHVCKEEEVEVPADQQLWNQEVKSSMKQEEPEELHSSQEGEQLVLKQETDAVTLTPTHEEKDHSEDQTLYMKAEDGAAQTESVDNLPVLSSVVGASNIDLLISNSSHVSVSHDERRESSKKDAEVESQFQSRRTSKTSKKPYVCKICKKGLSARSSLARHMKIHTGEKPYSCKTCGKQFRWKTNLPLHMTIHTGEKPYGCETCGKHFRWKRNLILHMRIHTGEMPYSCETCGKRFRGKTNLNVHRTIHTGERLYDCEICGENYRQKTYLNLHMRIHTGEKPHICKTCGKDFTVNSSLIQHMRIHTGEKPYICKTCGKGYTKRAYLNTHMKIHTE